MLKRATVILLLMTGAAHAEKFSQAYYDTLAADCRQVMKAIGGIHSATKQQIAEGLCLLIKIETRLPSGSPQRLDCAEVTQEFVREGMTRGMPIAGLCGGD